MAYRSSQPALASSLGAGWREHLLSEPHVGTRQGFFCSHSVGKALAYRAAHSRLPCSRFSALYVQSGSPTCSRRGLWWGGGGLVRWRAPGRGGVHSEPGVLRLARGCLNAACSARHARAQVSGQPTAAGSLLPCGAAALTTQPAAPPQRTWHSGSVSGSQGGQDSR